MRIAENIARYRALMKVNKENFAEAQKHTKPASNWAHMLVSVRRFPRTARELITCLPRRTPWRARSATRWPSGSEWPPCSASVSR